jgi:hypothetical protein
MFPELWVGGIDHASFLMWQSERFGDFRTPPRIGATKGGQGLPIGWRYRTLKTVPAIELSNHGGRDWPLPMGGSTMVQSERMHGLLREVDEAGFLSEGHFAFRSGKHALKLLDRDQLLVDTHLASKMGYAIAKHFFLSRIDIVAAPSVWGAGLAQWVGFFLDPRRPVIYPTPSNGHYTFTAS